VKKRIAAVAVATSALGACAGDFSNAEKTGDNTALSAKLGIRF